MSSDSSIRIVHPEGCSEFEIDKTELSLSASGLFIEIISIPNPNISIPVIYPVVYLENGIIRATNTKEISQVQLEIAEGWDTDEMTKINDICRIYVGHHAALDNNVINLSRVSNDSIQIEWKCDVEDLNYFPDDPRAQRFNIEIFALAQGV